MLVGLRRIVLPVGALALCASLASAEPEERKLSKLDGVSLSEANDKVVVRLQGTRPPDFTTFTLENPFRVVVDWSGSVIGSGPTETKFKGLVRTARLQQFDSEAERISRVTLELAARTTYELAADGHDVVVRLASVVVQAPKPEPKPVAAEPVLAQVDLPVPPKATGPLTEKAVSVPTQVAPVPPKPVKVAKVAPKPAPQPAAKPVPKPAPKPVTVARVEPVAPPPLKKVAPKPQPKPVTVAKVEPKPAPAPVVAQVETKPAPKVDLPLTEPATEVPTVGDTNPAVPVVVNAPEPVAVAKVEAKPAPVEPAPVEPAPVVVVKKPVQEPKKLAAFVPPAKTAAPSPVKKVEPKAVAAAPQPKPTRKLASFAPPRPSRSAGAASSGSAPNWRPPGLAAPVRNIGQDTPIEPSGTTEAPEGNESDDDYDPGPRIMKYIGFRQMAATSRVFVRIDGKARYRTYTGAGSFVVELLDTRVNVKNNTRPLDTSYFNSPVSRVQAVEDGSSTRIEVKLREGSPARIKRIGTTLAIDFTRQ